MTQLDNKAHFDELYRYIRLNPIPTFALLDIDNFDHINRAYSESIGDKMIKLTAEILRSHFPKPKGICLSRLNEKSLGSYSRPIVRKTRNISLISVD